MRMKSRLPSRSVTTSTGSVGTYPIERILDVAQALMAPAWWGRE